MHIRSFYVPRTDHVYNYRHILEKNLLINTDTQGYCLHYNTKASRIELVFTQQLTQYRMDYNFIINIMKNNWILAYLPSICYFYEWVLFFSQLWGDEWLVANNLGAGIWVTQAHPRTIICVGCKMLWQIVEREKCTRFMNDCSAYAWVSPCMSTLLTWCTFIS